MVKVKNTNVGRKENHEEGGSMRGGRTGKGKDKRVATEKLLTLKNGQGRGERLLQITELIYLTWKSHKDDEGNEGQKAMKVDKEESEEKPEEETFRREMRQKKRQERVVEEIFYKKNKRCTKGVSRVIYKEAKDHSRLQDFTKMKRSRKSVFYRKTGCPIFF
ncbi:hypothetical protein M9H77_13548 [Catharanthus roseus]|uniref:Uncharacterized protein n=1 Tax=Catharanthus roseus TaxID=4058 RepID=A0ACC0BKQ0_CATRO|nr:hypothetical protein M9H77_13548 [Catharanthus roseus]